MSFSMCVRLAVVGLLCLCYGGTSLAGTPSKQHELTITVEPSGTIVMDEWETQTIVVTATDTEPAHTITLTAVDLPSFAEGWDGRSGTSPVVDTVVLAPRYCDAVDFHNFWFEASCTGGLQDASDIQTLTVNNVNRPPESPVAPEYVTVMEHDPVSFTVIASDADHEECGDTLILELENPPVGSAFVDHGDGSGTFTWADATPGGEYSLEFLAIDEEDTSLSTPTLLTVAADTLDLVLLECVEGAAGRYSMVTRVYLRHTFHEIGAVELRANISPPGLGKFTGATFSPALPDTRWARVVNVFPPDSTLIEIFAADTTGSYLSPADTTQLLFELYGKLAAMTHDSTGQPIPMPDTAAEIETPKGNSRLSWGEGAYEVYPPSVACSLSISEFVGGLFIRGDATADGSIDIFDGLRIIYWLGGEADAPPCEIAADVNDDGAVDIFDGLRVVYYLGGEADPPPDPCCVPPEDCGGDLTPGGLTCDSFPPCDVKGEVMSKVVFVGSAEESRLEVVDGEVEDRTVVASVVLANAEPLIGFSWTLEYDPGLLMALAVDNSGLVTEEFDVFVCGLNEPGLVRVVGIRDLEVSDGVKRLSVGEREVVRVIFKLVGSLDRDASLDLIEGVMAISHDRALNHVLVSGAVKATSPLPLKFELSQNYPNPFNPLTTIRYAVPRHVETFPITLCVYDLLGQVVRTLVNGPQTPGHHAVVWNGRDDGGREVASGVYFYRLAAGEWVETRRMVLLK